jgi:uncharacterized protein with von Willebrand factor type A (vWA) domain
MSMTGVWNSWAESLSLRIIDLGKSQRMRMGYLEFNHRLKKVSDSRDGFFMRDHTKLSAEVRQAECSGVTDYQLPLQEALAEFSVSKSRRHDRHIVFLTDGLPTAGCKNLKAEVNNPFFLVLSRLPPPPHTHTHTFPRVTLRFIIFILMGALIASLTIVLPSHC